MRPSSPLLRLAFVGLLALSTAARAESPVQITEAWTRATPGQSTIAAVYLKIASTQDDRLTGASTPMAAEASLHLHQMTGGTAEMRAVDSVDITAGKTFIFAPMSYHIMLTGVKAPLKSGDHFPLTLTFARAGDVTTDVSVKALRTQSQVAPKSGSDGMSGMSGMSDMPGMGKTQ